MTMILELGLFGLGYLRQRGTGSPAGVDNETGRSLTGAHGHLSAISYTALVPKRCEPAGQWYYESSYPIRGSRCNVESISRYP